MQDLTPTGKTTVETANSANIKKHKEVKAMSASWKSASPSTNKHSEQVIIKLLHRELHEDNPTLLFPVIHQIHLQIY